MDDEDFDPEVAPIRDWLFDTNPIEVYNQGFVEGIEAYLDALENLDVELEVEHMVNELGWNGDDE